MNTESRQLVLITAGANGIGRVMATAFLASGYDVHVCDVDEQQLSVFQSEHPGAGGTVTDVSDPDAVDAMMNHVIGEHGRLDILINNAGIAGPTAAVENIETSDWKKTLAVDIDGPFFCTRAAVPHLKKAQSASIINIASTAGLFGFPFRLPYCASKWAMIGMTKTLASELGPSGIRVNAICPGSVAGPRIEGVIERDALQQGVEPREIRDLYQRQSSLRCFIDPEDVAAMALFLASDAAAKVSGQAIAVDGHTESLSSTPD